MEARYWFTIALIIVALSWAIYFIVQGFIDYGKQHPKPRSEPAHKYVELGYQEQRIYDCVGRIHSRLINELANEAAKSMCNGLTQEDVHLSIKSAVESFQDEFGDDVIREIILHTSKQLDRRTMDS